MRGVASEPSEILEYLAGTYQETVQLMLQIPLKDEPSTEADAPKTILDLTQDQRTQASGILRRYHWWCRVVGACIRRLDERASKNFDDASVELESYIQMQRVGSGISHDLWRALFQRELAARAAALVDIVSNNLDAFSVFRDRQSIDMEECDVAITEVGGFLQVEARSPLGSAKEQLEWTFSEEDLELFLLRHCSPRRRGNRSAIPPSIDPISKFGFLLFQALFKGTVRDLYLATRTSASASGKGLRLKLRLADAARLWEVPWEILSDGTDFLALTSTSSIVRHLDRLPIVAPLEVKGPLKILVSVSSPGNLPQLDVEGEIARIRRALGPVIEAGVVQLDVARDGTLRTLQRQLSSAKNSGHAYNVWHYIGHGHFDERSGASVLDFERDGRSVDVSGFEVGTLLRGYDSLRFVLLNACETATSDRQDVMSAVGSAIAQRSLASVLAMQFPISDEAATVLSEEVYFGLVDQAPLDLAVTEARRAIFFDSNFTEWFTPVLYMRTQMGNPFNWMERGDER